MKTPDRIWLIDLGDEITWCDSHDPSDDIDTDDTVEYVKSSSVEKVLEAARELRNCISETRGKSSWDAVNTFDDAIREHDSKDFDTEGSKEGQ